MKLRTLFLLSFAAIAFPQARALIRVGQGNEPVADAGWPAGAVALANLQSRVGWWEGPPFGGGEWQFLYRGNTAAFAEALAVFGAIRAPALELVLHDEAGGSPFLDESGKKNAEGRFDWSFTVWIPASWHQLYNNPRSFFSSNQPGFRQPVDPPRLDLYLGGAGAIDFTKIKVPANVRVRDERASAAGLKLTEGAFVRVDVFDLLTGKPVPGARVTVRRLPEGKQNQPSQMEKVAESVTDAAGRADVAKIPAGICRLSAEAPGYAPRLLAHDQFGERSFRRFNILLAKVAALRGLALDSAGAPLKGVRVRADSTLAQDGRGYPPPDPIEALTDDAGRFELAGLPMGFTTVAARRDGYYFGDLFALHDIPGTGDVRLTLSRAAKVRVTVTDKAGKPMAKFEGASVLVAIEPKDGARIGKWSGSAEVKADGTMEFSGIPAGEYRVTSRPNPANSNRTYAPEKLVTLEPGADLPVTMVYD